MWLLAVSVIILIIVIVFIVYASRPVPTAAAANTQYPCNRCGVPKPRCRCARRSRGSDCPFC